MGDSQSTPQINLNDLLNIYPLEMFVKGVAAKTALRLSKYWEIGYRAFGDCAILSEFGRALLGRDMANIASIVNFLRILGGNVKTRGEWVDGCFI